MAKHIHKGWATSSDEIPQPISITLEGNLRRKLQASTAAAQRRGQAGQAGSAEVGPLFSATMGAPGGPGHTGQPRGRGAKLSYWPAWRSVRGPCA
jgi:hypothetical protein